MIQLMVNVKFGLIYLYFRRKSSYKTLEKGEIYYQSITYCYNDFMLVVLLKLTSSMFIYLRPLLYDAVTKTCNVIPEFIIMFHICFDHTIIIWIIYLWRKWHLSQNNIGFFWENLISKKVNISSSICSNYNFLKINILKWYFIDIICYMQTNFACIQR